MSGRAYNEAKTLGDVSKDASRSAGDGSDSHGFLVVLGERVACLLSISIHVLEIISGSS